MRAWRQEGTCDQDELREAGGGADDQRPAQHPPQRHRLEEAVVHPHACADATSILAPAEGER